MVANRFPVVGVGASAGGVEALQAFFRPMPGDPGMAFVVVMHLGEGYQSVLPQILARSTGLPIVAMRDDEIIEANRIYVLTSNAVATVHRGRVRLRPQTAGARERNTVDALLASLAEDFGDRSIGVILSGSGHDGTLGAKAIREKGGLTVAQTPDHGAPQYPEMPSNAIASGSIDLQIPVEEMAPRLVEYAQTLGALEPRGQRSNRGERNRVDKARREICQILRDQVGHDFSGYKARTFLRRVERRMHVLSVRDIDDYLARLSDDRQEVVRLFNDLLIGVTAFFRDREAFQALADSVIPELFAGKGASDAIRIWIPGCATGEEVYSLAILLIEHMDTVPARPKVVCFATDIDETAIAVARAARYPAGMLQNLNAERLDRFFTGDATSYSLTKEVRDLCIFSSHSVIRDPPFSRLDLISCRNLLIYLDKDFQQQIIPLFHYALRPDGFLFLGLSENLAEHAQLFTVVDKQFRLYRRRENPAVPLHLPLLIPEVNRRLGFVEPRPVSRTHGALPLRDAVESRIVEQFAPAHIVVTRDGEAVHFSARTGKYLENAAGAPTRNIIAMARRGLRFDLRTTLAEAVEKRGLAHRLGARVEFEDRVQIVDLVIEPLSGHDDDPLFLVVFVDVGPALLPEQMPPVVSDEHLASTERIERELHDTREQLQSVIEEYETALEELKSANEELVSINEELQSANEELETSREETQSINEELNSVNGELERKVGELDRANDSLRNLFEGTEIALVFLDRDLVIRNFTPAIKSIFSLIDIDRGRPLTDISNELVDLDLRVEIEAVLADGRTRERKTTRRDGKTHYLMRVLPYYTTEHALDGALVTFTDITHIPEVEEQRRELTHRIETTMQSVLHIVEGGAATDAAPAAPETVLDRLRALGRTCALLSQAGWEGVALADLAADQLDGCGIARDGRVTIAGPPVLLREQAAVQFGMALHELAASAVRDGALSVPQGRVQFSWVIESGGTPAARLAAQWRESGGPEPPGPASGGQGGEPIEMGLMAEVGAAGTLRLMPGGVVADLTLPLSSELVLLPDAAVAASGS